MGYAWSRDGVIHAVEDAMRAHPEMQAAYEVADARDTCDFTWHVEIDPLGNRRVARLTWQVVESGQLDELADLLREASPAW